MLMYHKGEVFKWIEERVEAAAAAAESEES